MKTYRSEFIDKGQYLSDIWKAIPSNIILSKTLTGIGATTLEIEAKRHSIIIEPNIPVIQGKVKKYNTKAKMLVRGVFQGVTEDHLTDYLNSKVEFKKFIVTPESFRRVKEAIESIGVNMYEEYFLLFDECERAVQDVAYRPNVILPMNDFFKFKGKAFISATPIMPSDPRFKKHQFQPICIAPTFDYKKDITVLVTDNTLFSLNQFIQDNPRDKYFIFIKSTEHIAHIIKSLGILKESAVFCAKDSKEKLMANDFTHVSVTLTEFQKYNFFTSRFNSAVDIDYDGEPTVLIVSDVITTEHSTLDPISEVVQISGRFRKELKDLVHITNLNPLIKFKSEVEVLSDIKEAHSVYKVIRRFYDGSTSLTAKETLRQMLDRIDYAKYVDWKGDRNHYMVDNTIHEEKVKSYYQSEANLLLAYKNSQHFNCTLLREQNAFTEADQLKLNRATRLKSVYEVMIPILKDLYEPGKHTQFHIYFHEFYLKENYPRVLADFKRLGYEEVERLGFDPQNIKKAIKRLNNQDNEEHFGLITYIAENFKEHKCYKTEDIERILKYGLEQMNLLTLTPGISLLKKFCTVSRCTVQTKTKSRKEIKGYVIDKLPKR